MKRTAPRITAPHPAFGHLLPARGEKDYLLPLAPRAGRGCRAAAGEGPSFAALTFVLLFLVACNREAPAPHTQAIPPATASVEDGRQLVTRYGCGVCHVVPGVEGAQGQLGPSLAGVASRPAISFGTVENTPANLAQFIREPASKNPQTSMPPMAITEAEAEAIAAYLRTLK